MKLKKGDRVLCVENNSTVRPLVIESTDGGKVLFSKQLDKGIKKTFGLKKGSFQIIKPRYISEHEKKEYINPELERHDRVRVIHVDGGDENNLLGRNATVIAIKENSKGDREVWLWVEGLSSNAAQAYAAAENPNPVPYILELERRTMETNYPHESIPGELVQKSLVLKLDEPQGKQEDYIDDLLYIPEHTEQLYTGGPEDKKQELSPELEVGDRIMAWDISPAIEYPGEGDNPSTFLATVQKVIDYDAEWENAIRYLVKLEDTDEVIGLYGGEIERIPSENGEFTYEGRDKWLKLPKLKITEDSDIFGQGLLDPIEPEEFEGEEEEWKELVGDVEDDDFVVEPEYDYEGGKTNPEVGFVAPSAEVTDNICRVKGFCDAQGPITFGQLKALVEEATKKRIGADIGRGIFKSLWRIVPFFIPQVLLASVGVTVTRAFNKVITPALKDTQGYKSWWGKVVLKAMDIAEGDYIPDVALGDDPLSKIFFISDGLLQMIRDKYKLKFARYVAEYASSRPDNEPVPEWFVENLLRDYLNQKFLLDPPFEPKEGTDFQMIREHDEEGDPEDGIQTREPFTRTEAQILNYLAKEFTWAELNTISSIDETQVMGDLEKKWDNTLKLFGQAPKGDEEAWIRSTRWAKWAVENWEEAKVEMDGGGYSQDFKNVTTPIKSWPAWFEVDAEESYWQKEFTSGTIELGAYDSEDAEERAEGSWWEYDPDMEHYDYGDTDDHEIEMGDVRYMKALNEHDQPQDKEAIDAVQDIVDSVYPHIVNNLGKSEYVDETPKVELHRDIYERLSDIEGMEGEESKTSKSEYESHVNTIYIYYPNMGNEKDVIQALLHEYTHSLQDPEKWEEYRRQGYEGNPYEQQSSDAEDNWEEYLIYLQENINEHQETKVSPELEVDDIIMVIEVEGDDYNWEGQTKRPETFAVYRVLGKDGFAKYDGSRSHYDLIKLPVSKETRHRIYTIYVGDTWIYADAPPENKVDRKTISEHKKSKLNPDLMVGDEIMVVSTEGVHDFGAPELYKPYVVVGIKHGTTMNRELHNWTHGEDEEQTPDRWDSPEVPRSRLGFRKEFDTIPYTYYQIEPIGMTDEERTGAMLAGGGRMKPMYIFPSPSEYRGSDQWILNPGFLRGEHLAEEKESSGFDYVFGDSIAKGLNDYAKAAGWQRKGAGPKKILGEIKKFTEDMSGKKVLLSSGYSNNAWGWKTIKRQIEYLNSLGATVSLLGVSETFQKFLDSKGYDISRNHNKFIKGIAISSGAEFKGGFEAGDDNVHPINNDYQSLYNSISAINEQNLSAHYFQGRTNIVLNSPELEQDLKAFHGLEIDEEEELDEFCPMGNPNKCTPVNYDELPDMVHEHIEGRNMKGFTPKLIGYLKFLFETTEISDDYMFVREATSLFNISEWEAQALYLILMYNSNHTGRKEMLEMLNNMPIEDYVIPFIWEYEITYYGEYEQMSDEEECSEQGHGQTTGEDCECEQGVKYVEDKDGYEEEEDCDYEQDDDCECQEWWRKEYEMYYNNICTKTIYSTTKLEKTHEGSDEAYGYEQMYEIEGELNDNNSIIEHEDCDLEYDDGNTWEYFHERDDDIIGMDTDKWVNTQIPRLLEKINNKIYKIKPLIDIIEDQYDVMSDKDTKMKDLTSQIFDILDDNFDMFEHPEGEIEYDGKNMGLYSHHNDSFVPFEHIYNPIIQMLEGGIQQEDIEVFVEIITNWVNYVMSEKREYLNEEVNIKSDDSNYSHEDYENFVDFAHKELKIDKDCPIDVETEPSSEYTTGNYHIRDRKIKILDNGRKLADILRTIAHELVHHKQNELDMLVGDIPEIGGKIEDQANAYAGRLVKKYGKQKPNLYMESKTNLISEEKMVNFDSPTNNFVVIAGGPGAGKSFITNNLINLDNVRSFNVDQVRVMTAKKLWGDDWEEMISTAEGYQQILDMTYTTSDPRNLTVRYLKNFLVQDRDNPVNVIYDAGGGQEEVMKDVHKIAKESGMVTNLVYVRTPLELAQIRNDERPRSLPDEMVAQYHQKVKDNMRNMIPIFDHVWIVDNKELIDLSDRPSDNIEKIK